MILHALLDDRGQGIGEYALILGFIAVLAAAAVSFVGSGVVNQFNSASASYP